MAQLDQAPAAFYQRGKTGHEIEGTRDQNERGST